MRRGASFLFLHQTTDPVFRLFTPQNKHLYVVIQQRKWSVHRGASFLFLHQKMLQYFDCLPIKINTFMSSFNNENDQYIAAHLLCFYIKKLIQYFDCLPLKINTFMSSFNNENDQCIAAHLFCFYIPKTNLYIYIYICKYYI